ncbi:hypothetical protein AAHA92_01311 [Salvia divinorum]|uniref:Uncharacterized protein n=1 Tax=Salvia divinorum TaxID=28513 RepID=A0ABD1IMG5_SALDI
MSPLRSQTLIKSCAARLRFLRRLSTLPDRTLLVDLAESEAKANAVEKVEDAIHSFIVRRSRPDWLTFVPGGSYWVPPRLTSYRIIETLSSALTEEEYLSLSTVQGWPSSAFYVHNDTSSHLVDLLDGHKEDISATVSIHDEEG